MIRRGRTTALRRSIESSEEGIRPGQRSRSEREQEKGRKLPGTFEPFRRRMSSGVHIAQTPSRTIPFRPRQDQSIAASRNKQAKLSHRPAAAAADKNLAGCRRRLHSLTVHPFFDGPRESFCPSCWNIALGA